MSYTPTDWKTGDTITAEKLNKLEGGIKTVQPLIINSEDVYGDNPRKIENFTFMARNDSGPGMTVQTTTAYLVDGFPNQPAPAFIYAEGSGYYTAYLEEWLILHPIENLAEQSPDKMCLTQTIVGAPITSGVNGILIPANTSVVPGDDNPK